VPGYLRIPASARSTSARSTSARPVSEQSPARRDSVTGLRPSQVPPVQRGGEGGTGPANGLVRAKLAIGTTDDHYEKEADRVADAVVRSPVTTGGISVQASAHAPRASVYDGMAADGTQAAVRRASGGGRPVEGAARRAIEQEFGVDFSGVRVHEDSTAHDLSEAFRATAFTSGSDIFLSKSVSSLSEPAGQRLMAHELTHVIQQGAALALSGNPPSRHAVGHGTQSPLIQRATPPPDKKAEELHREAVKLHVAQSKTLKGWLEEGSKSTTDRVLKNACGWIMSGLSKLYAVTLTGDSRDRVLRTGGDPDKEVAYFPKVDGGSAAGDIRNPGLATYNYNDLEDKNWNEDARTSGGKSFREAVIRYRDPDKEGSNKLDSSRIEKVYRALQKISPSSSSSDQQGSPMIEKLKDEIVVLSSEEAAYLLDTSNEFNDMLETQVKEVPTVRPSCPACKIN
jgi:Domain of unknown function (DUF4157)